MSDICWTGMEKDGGLLIRTLGVHRKRWQVEAAKDGLLRELPRKVNSAFEKWSPYEVNGIKIVKVKVSRIK